MTAGGVQAALVGDAGCGGAAAAHWRLSGTTAARQPAGRPAWKLASQVQNVAVQFSITTQKSWSNSWRDVDFPACRGRVTGPGRVTPLHRKPTRCTIRYIRPRLRSLAPLLLPHPTPRPRVAHPLADPVAVDLHLALAAPQLGAQLLAPAAEVGRGGVLALALVRRGLVLGGGARLGAGFALGAGLGLGLAFGGLARATAAASATVVRVGALVLAWVVRGGDRGGTRGRLTCDQVVKNTRELTC